MHYYDKQFRLHHSFPFVAFSIQPKQLALLSAKIHMHRQDFEADTDILANVTIGDLQEAQINENNHHQIQNEHVQCLQHHLYATSSCTMASGEICARYWTQIWGTCLWLRPPSLWLIINPIDYEDPVVQIFMGEKINMDAFMDIIGPSLNKRAENIAKDPFALAFFSNLSFRQL